MTFDLEDKGYILFLISNYVVIHVKINCVTYRDLSEFGQ